MELGVLISGSGTNFQAMIDAIDAGSLDAHIALVISSRPDAYGLKRAADAGIQTMALSREVYERDALQANRIIATELEQAGCGYVAMAGYMRMVLAPLLDAFPDRVVNIHPALLPSFPGAHGIRDTFEAGVKWGGVTVHLADADYDQGPIIAQQPVQIFEDDTIERYEQRIHEVEHRLYPAALQLIAQGRVHVVSNLAGRRVVHVDDAP